MLSRYGCPVFVTTIRSPGSAIRRALEIERQGPTSSPTTTAIVPARRSSPSTLSTKMSRAAADVHARRMQAITDDCVRIRLVQGLRLGKCSTRRGTRRKIDKGRIAYDSTPVGYISEAQCTF